MVETTSEEQSNLWNNIKCTNIRITGVPEEEEEKQKGYEKTSEEIIVENFSNMEKEIVKQVQEAWSPIQDKPKEKHVSKYKERILKAAREKQQVTYKRNPIHLADISAETLQARGNGRIFLKY